MNVINFSIKMSGMEQQMFDEISKIENPKLEQNKNDSLKDIVKNNLELIKKEDEILKYLSDSSENLVDDDKILDILKENKSTSEELKKQLESSNLMIKNINNKKEMYRRSATLASKLYFIL